MRREDALREATDIQRAALVFGVVFLLVTRVGGFIPDITSDTTTSRDSTAKSAEFFGISGTPV